jgi:4-amino-4-deoxy-L-arabinose transferase-like glycosyltransferase
MTQAIRDISSIEPQIATRSRGIALIPSGLRVDLAHCALLVTLTAIMLLPASLRLPMELWDESRTAVNAMEMATHGQWLVPTFDGAPDHWNTKPPLLIWTIAALLRSGVEPMLGVRLPSIVATMATVVLVWLTCRVVVQDRLAGLLSGLLVVTSILFMGDHVGRTGDYDALLSMLCLAYVIAIGRYIDSDTPRPGIWINVAGILLFLALLTKGIAACVALPGLFAYAIMRRRWLELIFDWRVWMWIGAVIAGMALYLILRERADPGYLAALWNNDVAGRMLSTLDNHDEAPFYYLVILATGFQPAMLLLPTLVAERRDTDPGRRRLCLLMLLTACSWLIVLSCAKTKLYWYIAPAVPLLAVAAGIATTTFLRRREQPGRIVFRPVCFALLLVFWYLNVRAPDPTQVNASDQVRYGEFLRDVRGELPADGAVIIDQGLPNDAGFEHYNPVALFHAEDADRHGSRIRIVAPGTPIANNATLISCDPPVREWLKQQQFFTALGGDSHCILGRLTRGSDNATKLRAE